MAKQVNFNDKHQLNTTYRRYEDNMWYNDALEYMIGQKAIYTLQNEDTGNRFTYKTKESKKNKNFLNVYVLTGPGIYSILGYIAKGNWEFRLSQFSTISAEAQSFKVFQWAYNRLRNNNLPPYIKCFHYNTCCRCGRPLTTPESIENGIGPICIGLRQFGQRKN